jgi:hypothetical protein
MVDADMYKGIRTDCRFTLMNTALHHATLRMSFNSSQVGTRIQIHQVIPT